VIYKIEDNKIKVFSLDEFYPKHIFECGQVFSYKKINDECYIFYPKNKVYLIYKSKEHNQEVYIIQQIGGKANLEEVINIFDLETSYENIKTEIKLLTKNKNFKLDKDMIKKSISFGYGIRILKQDFFEAMISFVLSQNNNIKRIKNSLDKLREICGEKIKLDLKDVDNQIAENIKAETFYSFPNLEKLANLDKKFFTEIGAGYRAGFLVDLIKELRNKFSKFQSYITDNIKTNIIREEFIKLKGIGRKVADCILLFGINRKNVFPVDTWIAKVYKDLINKNEKISPIKVSNILEQEFKNLSGYIQQYLFYYKRSLG
jgi:N-glycosylase/DNA lyase